MKKNVIVFTVLLFCFGCAKEDNNITINIYENIDQKETIEIQDDTNVGEEVEETTKEEIKYLNTYSVIHDESNASSTNESINKSKLEETKDWYDKNKDELSNINKEILNEDKETIINIIDGVTAWYAENKDELKSASDEIIENDKNTIKDLFGSASNWYAENKDEFKSISEDIYKNDRETLINLYEIIKNNV